MAHECPDCGYTCYCGGDIDDICTNLDEDIAMCCHCDGEYEDEYEEDDDEEVADGTD